jgi:hypothetical protein
MGPFPRVRQDPRNKIKASPRIPVFGFIYWRLMMKYEISRDPRRLPNAEECRKTTELLNKDSQDVPLDSAALKRATDDLGKAPYHRS